MGINVIFWLPGGIYNIGQVLKYTPCWFFIKVQRTEARENQDCKFKSGLHAMFGLGGHFF